MTPRHAPAPTHPSRLWLGLMAGAVAGMVAGTVGAAREVAPQVSADGRLSLTPERSPELSGHGGPLVIPSIGAISVDPPAHLPPIPVATTPRPAQRPATARQTAQGSTGSQPAPTAAPSAAETPSSATSTQTATESTQAATTTEESHVEDPTLSVGDVGAGSPETTATTTADTASASTTTSDVIGGLIDNPTGTSSEETAP
jgi:hypothetical protein